MPNVSGRMFPYTKAGKAAQKPLKMQQRRRLQRKTSRRYANGETRLYANIHAKRKRIAAAVVRRCARLGQRRTSAKQFEKAG